MSLGRSFSFQTLSPSNFSGTLPALHCTGMARSLERDYIITRITSFDQIDRLFRNRLPVCLTAVRSPGFLFKIFDQSSNRTTVKTISRLVVVQFCATVRCNYLHHAISFTLIASAYYGVRATEGSRLRSSYIEERTSSWYSFCTLWTSFVTC
jgi:hypothetical protein